MLMDNGFRLIQPSISQSFAPSWRWPTRTRGLAILHLYHGGASLRSKLSSPRAPMYRVHYLMWLHRDMSTRRRLIAPTRKLLRANCPSSLRLQGPNLHHRFDLLPQSTSAVDSRRRRIACHDRTRGLAKSVLRYARLERHEHGQIRYTRSTRVPTRHIFLSLARRLRSIAYQLQTWKQQ